MEKTDLRNIPEDTRNGLPSPPLELAVEPGAVVVDLPRPSDVELGDFPFREAVEKRESVREYLAQPLSLGELSYLLWCTQGVRRVIPNRVTLRNVPSAGARHALETFLLVNRVDDLKPGLYRYWATEHKLVFINSPADLPEQLVIACDEQDYVKTSAVTFFWVANGPRMTWSYGDRGYRYLFLDAGHVCQNLYCAAETISCGACAIGSFTDHALNALLGLDGEQRFVLYAATLGKKES